MQCEAGEVVHRRPGEGNASLEVGGDLIVFKASREDGVGSLFLDLVCPPGGGPPPHTDPSEELFSVLEGEFEFICPAGSETATVHATAGDSVVVPRRAAHTYRNVGASNGRLLVFFRDNEHMQPFFEELGDAVTDIAGWMPSGPPSIERAIAAAERHGIEVVGPPPVAS